MQSVKTDKKGLDIRRIATSELRARAKNDFVETGLGRLLDDLSFGDPIILMGEKGSGKTLNIEQWAHKNGYPFLRVSCTGETGDRELLGGFVLKSLEESWFALGSLATAVDVANEMGRCVLVLEEVNALNEEAQKVVNSIADYRREVSLPNIGLILRLGDSEDTFDLSEGTVIDIDDLGREGLVEVIVSSPDAGDNILGYIGPKNRLNPNVKAGAKLRPGTQIFESPKLWVVGTMNPDYGGTYDLNEDFRSRFQFVNVSFMSDDLEQGILTAKIPGRVSVPEANFIRGLITLAKDTRGKSLGYALSTRDLEQTVLAYLRFTENGRTDPQAMALKLLEAKFPSRSLIDFRARIASIFRGVDLSKVDLY